MALYFSRETGTEPLPPEPIARQTGHPNAPLALLALGLILILGIAEAGGFFHSTEAYLAEKTDLTGLLRCSPPRTPSLLLLEVGTAPENGRPDPMDLALALRGLALLRPSLIVMAVNEPATDPAPTSHEEDDSLQLLQSMKTRVHAEGIRIVRGVSPSPEARYRPVPLRRYLPTGGTGSLPQLKGTIPADGGDLYLPEPLSDGSIPLLASATDDGIAGSIWWDTLIEGQPLAPVWLLANRYLLLPNHTLLPCPAGVLSGSHDENSLRTISLEDFLLRIEEMERGTLRPGFESLCQGAIVVIGSESMESSLRTLASIRKTIAWGAVPLTWQLVTTLLLMILTLLAIRFRGVLAVSIALLIGLSLPVGGAWCLTQGIIPPVFPGIVALSACMTAFLPKNTRGNPL